MALTVREIRDRAERFQSALAQETYDARAGRKAWPEVRHLYAAQGVLRFERAVPPIQRSLAAASGDERRCLQRLLAWIAEHHVRAANADLDDEFAQWVATASVPHDGKEIPVRKLPGLVRSTEDRPTRRAYDLLRAEVLDEVMPLQLDRLNRWRTASREVGFGDHRAAIQRLTGLSLAHTERLARRLLADTQTIYDASLGACLVEHFGLSAVDAEAHDAEWLTRQAWLDGTVDEARCLDVLREDLASIGLPLTAEGRIDLQLEAFPTVGMRPACMAVRVPDRVLVLVIATSSVPGIRTLLRELGRGLHWAYTSPLLPFEFRALGDASVVDAHATLLGSLGRSPAWVKRAFGMDGETLGEHVRLAAFLELHAVRRMAARLLFDLELSESDRPGAMGPRWAELMNEATGFRHDPRGYLSQLGQRFGVARRLRGRLLAASLASELEARFGEEWFRNPQAGPFLGDWFAAGLSFPAEELAEKIGSGRLEPDDFILSVTRRLQFTP